jgi:Electron transfer DM13
MNQTQNKGTRNTRLIIAIIVLIPILAIAWWLGSPLFVSKNVSEAFPVVAGNVTAAEIEQVMTIMAKTNEEMNEDMPAMTAEPTLLASGSLHDGESFHKGSGGVSLYQLENASYLLRLENLNVTNGPALHVYLSEHANPVNGNDVDSNGFIDLGSLKGNIGNQNYEIPTGVDLSNIKSVVIYCKTFHVVFSVASLS